MQRGRSNNKKAQGVLHNLTYERNTVYDTSDSRSVSDMAQMEEGLLGQQEMSSEFSTV